MFIGKKCTRKCTTSEKYILHNKGGKIAAISVAKDDCYTAVQPKEVRDNSGEYKWDDNGFRIDTEYFDFSTPLLTAHLAQWAKLHHHIVLRVKHLACRPSYYCQLLPKEEVILSRLNLTERNVGGILLHFLFYMN